MTIRSHGFSLLLVGLLLAGGARADNETNGPPGPPKDLGQIEGTIPKIELAPRWSVSAQIPDVPEKLTVYAMPMKDPKEPGAVAQALMQKLEFKGVEVGVDEDPLGVAAIMHTDAAGRSVEFFRSGALFYMEEELFSERAPDLLERLQLDPKSAQEFFGAEGQAFLSEIGLDRRGMDFKDVSFMQVKSVQDQGSQESAKVVGAAAHFDYEIDGVPAWGPGAKTTVYFGPDGPTGFYDAMRDLEPAGDVALFSPAEVLSQYIAADEPRSLLRLHTGVVDETLIEEVKLTYYVGPGNEDQAFMEPYYLIKGTLYGWNPGPDPANPREGSTQAEPAPFVWMERAAEPVPEPGVAFGVAIGAAGLVLGRGRVCGREACRPVV